MPYRATQVFLLLLAIGSVPVLLLGKPLMIRSRNRQVQQSSRDDSFSSESQLMEERLTSAAGSDKGGSRHEGGHSGGHDEHNFSDIVIHQVSEAPTVRNVWHGGI